jgi:MFS family permease
MAVAQVVMVLVMSVVSLHMHHHDHGLGAVSLVMMAHTLGMFGLSVVNGVLANRLGRAGTIVSGCVLLIGGSLLAPVSLATPWIAAALFLVGLGWNQCYIAGSSLLTDVLAPSERGQIQGGAELMINLASAASSLSSGVIMAQLGFSTLSVVAAALSVIPVAMLGWRLFLRAQSHAQNMA